jgi:thiol-disulfide isomerase/thioredoxin
MDKKHLPMRKSVVLFLFIFLLSATGGYSQNRKIQFVEKPWQEVLEMAKKENKLIFMDAFATWCGPCKWIAAHMFTNDTVADYYNSHFICVSIDMEKGEGVEIRKTYDVRYYPTLLFLDASGDAVHKRVGAIKKADEWIVMGQTALDPKENLSGYMKRFNDGENSDAFYQNLLLRFSEAYMPVEPVLKKYFSGKSEQELLSETSWTIILNYVNDMNMPQFDWLVKHQHDYGRLYGKDTVEGKIGDIYLTALVKQSRSMQASDSLYIKLKKKILSSGFDGAGKVVFTSDLNLAQVKRDYQKFLDLSYESLEKYFDGDYTILNAVAKQTMKICVEAHVQDSLKYLTKATGWAKKSVSLKSEPANNDTYAALLFITGNVTEAITYEKNAIALAKEASLPFGDYAASLKKMEEQGGTKKP